MSDYTSLIESFKIKGRNFEIVPSVEFVQAPWGLNMKLFPTQRFLLRLLFGEPLDFRVKAIKVRNMIGDKVLYTFTERQYLRFLHEEGRCSIGEQGEEIEELVWSGGRKATKSTVISVVMAYQLYRFMTYYNPHERFHVLQDSQVRLTNLASSMDQADVVFSNVNAAIVNSPFFQTFLYKDPSSTQIKLYTRSQYDRRFGKNGEKENKRVQPAILLTIAPSTAKGVRGPNNIVIVFDEIAHFQEKGKISGSSIYGALKPSIAQFSEIAKTLSISSPHYRRGIFWDLHNAAKAAGDHTRVYLQTPTAEFNPVITSSFLKSERDRDQDYFNVEYGSMWAGSFFLFIQRPERFDNAITESPRMSPKRGMGTVAHYCGVDVAADLDGTAYAIGHAESDVVVVDNVFWYYPGVGKYENTESLPFLIENVEGDGFDGLIVDLKNCTRMFPIKEGLTDQWNGKGFTELAVLNGIPWLNYHHYTAVDNWEVAELFMSLLREGKVRLVDIPEVTENIKDLERIFTDRRGDGKKMYQVRAPNPAEGDEPPKGHDDIWSAVSRLVWLVYTREIKTGKYKKHYEMLDRVRTRGNRNRPELSLRMQMKFAQENVRRRGTTVGIRRKR